MSTPYIFVSTSPDLPGLVHVGAGDDADAHAAALTDTFEVAGVFEVQAELETRKAQKVIRDLREHFCDVAERAGLIGASPVDVVGFLAEYPDNTSSEMRTSASLRRELGVLRG